MSEHYDKSRLILITGPMMAGKTSELQRQLRKYNTYCKVLAVNHIKDIRYGDSGIINHDGHKIDGLRIESLNELKSNSNYVNSHVIGIDEGQFFEDLFEFVSSELKNTRKTFVISGLIGTFKRNLFGNMHKLFPLADDIVFLHAVCKRCSDGTPASFSAALVKMKGEIEIGGSSKYEAVCSKHYYEIDRENIKNSQ